MDMQWIFFEFTVHYCDKTCTIPVQRLRRDATLSVPPPDRGTRPLRTPEAQQPHLRAGMFARHYPSSFHISLALPFRLCSPDMLEVLTYLQGPELVARFQRRCGLYLVESAHHIHRSTPTPSGETVYAEKAGVSRRLEERWDPQDNNSNYKYKENGCAVSVSDA